MAPEMLNQQRHGKKVDIWSFGCTVIEMASGAHPWPKCETFTDFITLVNKLKRPPIPEHLTPQLKDFLEQCFTWDPHTRPKAVDLISHPFIMEEQ